MLEVDAAGNTVRQLSYDPPVPGDDVYLSIDANVQAITEQALHDELVNAHNRRNKDGSYNQSPAGAAVILDPNNGQVVAMASYPDYDPSTFVNGISSSVWDPLQDPNNHFPLNNRALQGQYAPGSTFKLVTALAGLRTGVITPATTISDGGRYIVPGCKGAVEQCSFVNSGGTAHGRVNLPRALTVSSDVYFYQLGGQFWTDRSTFGDPIQDTAKDLGFAAGTGIPLDEQKGFVLTPGEKQQLHDQNPTAYPYGDWFTGDNVQLAIGQNTVTVTPLQLANAYSTMANGGTLYSPNIAIKITQGGTNDVVRTIEPRVLHQVAMPAGVPRPDHAGSLWGGELVGRHGVRRVPVVPELAGRRQDRYGPGHRQAGHGAVRRHRSARRSRNTSAWPCSRNRASARPRRPPSSVACSKRSPIPRRRRRSDRAACCPPRCSAPSTTPTEAPTDDGHGSPHGAAQPGQHAAPQSVRGVAPPRPRARRVCRRGVAPRRADGLFGDARPGAALPADVPREASALRR